MAIKFKVHGRKSNFRSDSRHRLYDVKRYSDDELGPIAIFRGSGRWQKIRATQIQKDPVCYDPFNNHQKQGLPALTESVHHVIGLLECHRLGQLDRLGSIPENLRSVCNACHNALEGIHETRGAEAAKRIFISPEQELEIIKIVIPDHE